MKKLIAGNWKMNGSRDGARTLIADIVNRIDGHDDVLKACEFLVCPPAVFINDIRHALHGYPAVKFGAQDCSAQDNGAYTGELSAAMLKDAGCSYVIVGHSERRQYHGETSDLVAQKAAQVLANDMIPIICVGETLEQREQGKEEEIVGAQLKESIPQLSDFSEIVIAYEPVWAIGTGKTASVDDVKAMHAFIRTQLSAIVSNSRKARILYGGSMKPENAEELLACENVDGGLIGGASLKAESFLGIARAS